MAAPLGNTNAQTHGVSRSRRLAREGVRSRRLPKGYRYVASEASAEATRLYNGVEAAVGEVDCTSLATIEAASAWYQHALFTLRTLRIDGDKLTPMERIQASAEYAKSIQKRSDQVRLLKLSERKPAFNGTLPAIAKRIEAAQ